MALFGESSSALEIVIRARDDASRVIEDVEKRVNDMQPAFKTMAAVGTAGFAAITGAMALSVRESMKAEAAQNRLTHILRTSRGATDDQVQALLRQADALEQVGVVGGEAIVQAQAQLATFDLSAEAIERLTPAILDYVVAEKGAAASTDDLKSLTNGLAQALQGNFSSLTRTGFVLDDVTKEMIKSGTETERTAALVSVLNSTYEGFNAAARDTAEGAMRAINNELRKMGEAIGDSLLPILKDLLVDLLPVVRSFAEWAKENPELVRNILLFTTAAFGLLAVIGAIGMALPGLIIGFKALGFAVTFAAGPFGIIIGGAVLLASLFKDLIAELYGVEITWMDVFRQIAGAVETVVGWVKSLIDLIGKIPKSIPLFGIPGLSLNAAGTVLGGAGSLFGSMMSGASSALNQLLAPPSFQHGGIVPGPAGMAVPIIAHAGERVIPAGDVQSDTGNITNVYNFYGDVVDHNDLMRKLNDAMARKVRLGEQGIMI